MASSSHGGPPPSAKHLFFKVVVDKKLLSLLTPYKKMNFVTTYAEVLDALRIYILEKKLFDPAIPVNINCCGDDLSSVLGVEKFTVYDVRKLLQKFVFPVHIRPIPAGTAQAASTSASNTSRQNTFEVITVKAAVSMQTTSVASSDSSQKRKAEDSQEGGALKKSCDQVSMQPMYLFVPPSPSKDVASSDTAESIQGYETAFVADTSDDSFPTSDESDSNLQEGDIVTVEETFDVEYELASDSDQDTRICITESGSDSETGHNTVITFVCKSDSDENFWADKSSDEEYESDLEILESDKWKCKRCNSLNNPPMRYCIKCWCMRSGWIVPKRNERRAPRKRRHKTKRNKKLGTPSCALPEEESSCSSKPCTSSSSNSAAESLSITMSDNVDNFQKQPENTMSDNIDNFQKQPENTMSDSFQKQPENTMSHNISKLPENTDSLPKFPIISYEVESFQECSNSSSNSSQESLSIDLTSNYFSKSPYSSDVSTSSQDLSTLSSYSSSQEFRSTSPYSSSSQEFSSSSYSSKSQRDVIKSLKHFSTLNLSNVPKCDSEAKLCLLCCSKPANASIIHGKYAHQISCYRCARKLQYENKRCPVCRRTIDRVVHQINNIG